MPSSSQPNNPPQQQAVDLLAAQNLLRATLDSSMDMIQVFQAVRSQQGQLVDFTWILNNQAAEKTYGQVLGKSLLQCQPGVVEEGIFEAFKQVLETGLPQQYEKHYVHEQFDGWFHQSVVKLNDGVVTTTADITSRKQAEQEILRLKEDVAQTATDKYQSLFESIDEGVAIVEVFPDQSGRITDMIWREANPGVERHAGMGGWVGKRASEIVPNLEPDWLDAMTSVYQTGKPVRMEAYIEDLDRWIDTYYSRVGGSGSPLMAAVFQDITERKHRERHQAFLLQFSDALRAEPDADALTNRALHLLAGHLQLDRCYVGVYLLAEDRGVFPYQVGNDRVPPMPNEGVRLSDFPQALRVTFDETLIITDFQTTEGLSDVDKRNFDAFGFGALMVATVRKGEKNPYWAINAVSARPRRWTSLEIQLVEEVTERTWAAVERVRAEAALRESQKRFESIANLVPDLLWDSKPDGATNWYNQRWLAYTGQRFDEAIGWGWIDAIHPDDREATAKRYGQAVAAGQSLRQEHRIRRHDGAYRWFVVSASPLTDETGRVVNMYGAATDIHDHKRLEATLREADRRKDEFLAMLAHELRNPLAPLRNGLQILTLAEGANPELAPLVALMNRQLDHLVRLVDDLLDVSRISQGKIELKRERLDLGTLVSGAVEAARPLYQRCGQTLNLALPTKPLLVNGDATRLAQVVTNLLTNGSRYTGEDGWVRVSLESVQGEARLRVADNGIGLESGQLESIFELFVQVDNSVARSQGGLGLGLTLVKRLVELHGGRIEARSGGLGQGSEFSVYLPLLTEDELPPTIAESTPQHTGQPSLLVIDDNADSALTLAMLLRLKGYEVHTRSSGRAGLEAAEQLRPALILLDIGMPDLDGYQTCRLLRQQPWGNAVPVIALTGYGQAEDHQRTLEAGFNAHLVKPVDLVALTQSLTQLLVG